MWINKPDMVKYQTINESMRFNLSIRISMFLNIHYGAGFKKRTKVLRLKNSVQTQREEALLEQKRGRLAHFRKIIIILLIIIIVHHYYQSLSRFKNLESKVQASIG